jgi:hypothetical protein
LLGEFKPRQILTLMDGIRAAEEDFFRAATRVASQGEGGDHEAIAEFRTRWPNLSDEAVAALSWCFASLGS